MAIGAIKKKSNDKMTKPVNAGFFCCAYVSNIVLLSSCEGTTQCHHTCLNTTSHLLF
jgi:hypothetical protein